MSLRAACPTHSTLPLPHNGAKQGPAINNPSDDLLHGTQGCLDIFWEADGAAHCANKHSTEEQVIMVKGKPWAVDGDWAGAVEKGIIDWTEE